MPREASVDSTRSLVTRTGLLPRLLASDFIDGLMSVLSLASIFLSVMETANIKTWGNTWVCLIQLLLNVILTCDPLARFLVFGKEIPKFWYWLYELMASALILPGVCYFTITRNPTTLTVVTYLLLLRLSRFFRIFYLLPDYRLIFETIAKLTPLFVENLGVLFTLFYFYSVTGVHIFGGLFTSDVDLASAGFPPDYIYNNFNDVASGMVTLFEILFLNQWHIQMNMYAWVCNSKTVKLLFVSFYFFGYVIVVGLILAFTIDFILNKLQNKELNSEPQLPSIMQASLQTVGSKLSPPASVSHA